MARFRVSGDILHPGFVVIEADSEDALIEKMHDSTGTAMYVDEFEISDEQNRNLAFRWDGGDIVEEA